jgi:hypothetical protein
MLPTLKPSKSHFTELEAANRLGVSVEQLRVMVQRHIVAGATDAVSTPVTMYSSSDLVILKLLNQHLTDAR